METQTLTDAAKAEVLDQNNHIYHTARVLRLVSPKVALRTVLETVREEKKRSEIVIKALVGS